MTVKMEPERLLTDIKQQFMRGVVKATEAVRTEAIRLIVYGEKTGRMYGKHRASAPGEAPASDTGYLVNSIRTRYDVVALTGTVVVGAEYGRFLEFGTQNMEPRPFLRPALDTVYARINEIAKQSVQTALDEYKP